MQPYNLVLEPAEFFIENQVPQIEHLIVGPFKEFKKAKTLKTAREL